MATIKAKPRRRWLQFSLRTFLVALTIFSGWLGFQVNRAHRQRRAVAALEEMGWLAAYENIDNDWMVEDDGSGEPLSWYHRWLGRDYFLDVVEVRPSFVASFNGDYMNLAERFPERDSTWELPTVLAQVAHLPYVTTLHLDALPVTDDNLACLEKIANLRDLGLSQTEITNAGLLELARLQRLRRLDLSQTNTSDVGLKHLHALTNLKFLELDGTRVTESAIARLQAALPGCEVIAPRWFFNSVDE